MSFAWPSKAALCILISLQSLNNLKWAFGRLSSRLKSENRQNIEIVLTRETKSRLESEAQDSIARSSDAWELYLCTEALGLGGRHGQSDLQLKGLHARLLSNRLHGVADSKLGASKKPPLECKVSIVANEV
jgi:hypothetical protein